MDCQEFRNCWALSNLRPLSSKQNISDGNRRETNYNLDEQQRDPIDGSLVNASE